MVLWGAIWWFCGRVVPLIKSFCSTRWRLVFLGVPWFASEAEASGNRGVRVDSGGTGSERLKSWRFEDGGDLVKSHP